MDDVVKAVDVMYDNWMWYISMLMHGGYGFLIDKFVLWANGVWMWRSERIYRSHFGYIDPPDVKRRIDADPSWRPDPREIEYANNVAASTQLFMGCELVPSSVNEGR